MTWEADAACRGVPVTVFYPKNFAGQDIVKLKPRHAEQAKAICAQCPVARQCEDHHAHEVFGIWFGTTPAERGITRIREAIPNSHEPSCIELVRDLVARLGSRRFMAVDILTMVDHRHTDPAVYRCLGRLRERGEVQVVDHVGRAAVYVALQAVAA